MRIDDELLNELADRYMAMQKMTFIQFIEKELKTNGHSYSNQCTRTGESNHVVSGSVGQTGCNHEAIYGFGIVKGTGTYTYTCGSCNTAGFRTGTNGTGF